MNTSDLLNELRIERSDRDQKSGSSRWPWIAGGFAVIVLVLGGATWWAWPARAVEVEAVSAIAAAADNASTAVLQATGYVTARRMATVSAQIIGTLTEVLMKKATSSSRTRCSPGSRTARNSRSCTPRRRQRARPKRGSASSAPSSASRGATVTG